MSLNAKNGELLANFIDTFFKQEDYWCPISGDLDILEWLKQIIKEK